jgi:uncharacterized DUF497 family protein
MASILENCEGFEWDEWNSGKNWHKHQVTERESEEVFSNTPIIIALDVRHSRGEIRHTALGNSDSGRRLFVAFTVRDTHIRVISARDMNQREDRRYEEEIKRNS